VAKSYLDFMKEITPDQLYYGLLAHGLFTEKLPPVFTSVNFFDYCQSRTKNFQDIPSPYIFYESMREINIPRQLGIPNPITYHRLCQCLKDNWYKICEHFEKYTSFQSHKISRTHIRKLKNKPSLFEMNYKNLRRDGIPEPDLIIEKRYIVRSDITQFFPSIYTHSILWALVGKPMAKINRNKNFCYNAIDHYTQNIKNGETHGLLIGPHASNLLSEIILAVVDYKLHENNWNNFFRFVDDYTCYTETCEEGQKFIIDLSNELRHFDLAMNYKKTNISELPHASVEQWVGQIKAIIQRTKNQKMNFYDVQAYLDSVIELMHYNNDLSSILNYSIKVLSKQKMDNSAKIYCIKSFLHYAIVFPYLIPLLDNYLFQPFAVDAQLIEHFSIKIYKEGIKSNNNEEICFSLFFAIKYNFPLLGIDMDELLKTNSCVVMILAYLYFKRIKNKDACKKCKDYAPKSSLFSDDFGQFWLFIYEVLPKRSLTGDWKDMKEKQVSFLKAL
jgi:hypothetical protein